MLHLTKKGVGNVKRNKGYCTISFWVINPEFD